MNRTSQQARSTRPAHLKPLHPVINRETRQPSPDRPINRQKPVQTEVGRPSRTTNTARPARLIRGPVMGPVPSAQPT
ncbi:hypothetical protein BVRB_016230 [Beta vulgaris subsp. vulgaris]|uniref:Uncharacterized protein n=1 Tax=Beta vulgaris subsp. vulgaris TaxID=3555 RepID=A0A0J8B126_BETVV|nr:hypothetical protein BVRB_016230 [Beta vulgaris subsp. vulgaris]